MPKMASEPKPFIDLRDKPEVAGTLASQPEKMEKMPPRGPTLYINDGIALPLTAADVGEEMTAIVKVKLRNISMSVNDQGKERKSYDLEITAIKFGS